MTTRKKVKKKRRKLTPIMKLVCIIMIGASIWMLYRVGTEILTTIRLREELAEVQEKLQDVQDENGRLVKEKEKLTNPENLSVAFVYLTEDGKVRCTEAQPLDSFR